MARIENDFKCSLKDDLIVESSGEEKDKHNVLYISVCMCERRRGWRSRVELSHCCCESRKCVFRDMHLTVIIITYVKVFLVNNYLILSNHWAMFERRNTRERVRLNGDETM